MVSGNTTRNPKLSLTLGFSSDKPEDNMQFSQRQSTEPYLKSPKDYSPSLALCLQSENEHTYKETLKQQELSPNQQEYFINSGVSSFSNNSGSFVKREREVSYVEAEHADEVPPREGEHQKEAARKKLRLTKQQSAVLEDSFKVHNTLNPKQKLELAEWLKLRPRQVEVWFQNRRARTKLKQTEVECDLLKKCCEALANENRKLYKELEELKGVEVHPAMYMQHLPPATLAVCSSCEQTASAYKKSSTTTIFFEVPTRPPYT